ncbi:STAS/SEC14 domain-containing protein [bacterium]|nr:STAS/SEC14 domain-containing protein [bacterium]
MTIDIASIAMREEEAGRILRLTAQGKLTADDYEALVPELDAAIEQHGKIGLLVELEDFHGFTAGALWEDTKFGARHWNDIERIAVVGEGRLEKGMATFARPFTTAEVEFFEPLDRARALRWLHGVDTAAGEA